MTLKAFLIWLLAFVLSLVGAAWIRFVAGLCRSVYVFSHSFQPEAQSRFKDFTRFWSHFKVHVGVMFERIWAKLLALVLDNFSKPLGRHLGTFFGSFGAVLGSMNAEKNANKTGFLRFL